VAISPSEKPRIYYEFPHYAKISAAREPCWSLKMQEQQYPKSVMRESMRSNKHSGCDTQQMT
jgi:hypothetical protein